MHWSFCRPVFFVAFAVLGVTWSQGSESTGDFLIADFEGNGIDAFSDFYIHDWEPGGDTTFIFNKIDSVGNHIVVQDDPDPAAAGNHVLGIGAQFDGGYSRGIWGAAGVTLQMSMNNLEGCAAVTYKYKGSAHDFKAVMRGDDDCSVTGCDNHQVHILASDVHGKTGLSSLWKWETAVIKVSSLKQNGYGSDVPLDMSQVVHLRWEFDAVDGVDELYVDDVRCTTDTLLVDYPKPKSPAIFTELVDDFEDTDIRYALWPMHGDPDYPVGAVWDVEVDQWADPENPGASTASFSAATGKQSRQSVRIDYELDQGDYPYDPFVALGVSWFSLENLSQCSAIQYDYKGAAHDFRVKTDNDEVDVGWGFHSFAVPKSESWQTVTVPWSSLEQRFGNPVPFDVIKYYVNGFDWRIDGNTGDKGFLQVDNVRCLGLPETKFYTITFMNGSEVFDTLMLAERSSMENYAGKPTKEPSTQFTYRFSRWADMNGLQPSTVTGDATYYAMYNTVSRTYSVSFLDWDGTTLKEPAEYAYGTPGASVDLPDNPTRPATAQYTYEFVPWAVADVVKDSVYTAVYIPTLQQYAIAFVDEDGESVLGESKLYDYGTAVDDIDVPSVPDQADKRFVGWEPGLATVTKAETYKAVYTDKFVVTWKDFDGSVLKMTFHEDGDTPVFDEGGVNPTRAATAQYTYSFKGWSPAVVNVSGDTTYTATYDSAVVKYTIFFVDENGNSLAVPGSHEYGVQVSALAPTPTMENTAEYTFTFVGWIPAITDESIVTGDATYTAIFDTTKNTYTITFVGDKSVTGLPEPVVAEYGTNILSLIPWTEPVKPMTVEQKFEFEKWTYPDGKDVKGDATLESNITLTAKFNAFDRMYAVTFVDYDDKVIKPMTLYAYGTEASVIVPEEIPTRDDDAEFSYTFADWDPAVTDVLGDVIYKATYSSASLAPQESSSSNLVESSSGDPVETSSSIPVESSSGNQPESSSSSGTEVSSSSGTPVELSSSSKKVDSSSSSKKVESSSSSAKSSSSKKTEASSSSGKPVVSSSSKKTEASSSSGKPVVSSSSKKTETSSSSGKPVVSSSSSKKVASSSSKKTVASSSSKKVASSSSKKSGKSSSSSKGKSDVLPAVALADMGVLFTDNSLVVTASQSSRVLVQVFDILGNGRGNFRADVSGSHVFSLQYLEQGRYLIRVNSGSSIQNLNVMIK